MRGLGYGFKVGHWTNSGAATGCTVVIPPPGNVTSCDIRGSSPSSREIEHLHPDRKLTEVSALLLTGGSAFGLAAADGVVRWLEERSIGYETPLGPVPIVAAAVVFDLGTGDAAARPDAEAGRIACESAGEDFLTGAVGAGAGATVGKWAGFEFHARGGLGFGEARHGNHMVSAIAVVNAVGDVVGADGSVLAGSSAPEPRVLFPRPGAADIPTNTVLAVVTTSAALDKRDVRWLAARGSDGIALSIRPAHTRYDGDVVFAVAAPEGAPRAAANLDVLGFLATAAVAAAVRDAVNIAPP